MARTIINLDSTTQQSEWFNLIGGSSLAIIDTTSIMVTAKIKIKIRIKDTNNDFVEAFYQSKPNVDMEFTNPQVIPFSLVGEATQIQFILLNESVGDIVKIGIDHK